MESGGKKRYRLYAASVSEERMEEAARERFCRIGPRYILIYTEKEPPEGAVEITEAESGRLGREEARWIRECNLILLAEDAARREESIAADMTERLKRLEEALQAEWEKTNGTQPGGRTEQSQRGDVS